jgi:hypothetical protein
VVEWAKRHRVVKVLGEPAARHLNFASVCKVSLQ